MMILAVAIHNLPEGMAVGAVFAGLKNAGTEVTLASAFALSVGIAIQNFPEGAMEKEETEQTFDFFCTFILYSDIIAKENEDNRFIGGISWIILN